MEEVDKILIHALRQVGTLLSEEIDSVKQFSSELIVEAVVRCIRVIDPGLGGALPTSLPPGMSARFRVGMSLAQACQDVGFKGEIGYQTFLYSHESEIRSLLMFLVEKLPRESAEASDQPTGKSAVLQRSIAAAIRSQLAISWVPPNCRLPLHCEAQNQGALHSLRVQPLSVPYGAKGFDRKHQKEAMDYRRDVLPPVTAQISSRASLVASILEQHTTELSAAQEWDNEWKSNPTHSVPIRTPDLDFPSQQPDSPVVVLHQQASGLSEGFLWKTFGSSLGCGNVWLLGGKGEERTGTLGRTFPNCNQLIQTIEDTGTILREIRDLEEQIETENSNKSVSNLQRILDDYKAIRQENAALAAKIREG
uniref:Coiled-coil domain-containing protein 22 n=1 Tax=Nothobranchius kadleci TaxID=1051664 RepID=A0A1A8CEG9_NOTKA